MANEIEKVNTIAFGDIEKINTITEANIEKFNTFELSSVSFIAATGGSIATSGDYKVHSFTSNGRWRWWWLRWVG
jgi:hypothetical protein